MDETAKVVLSALVGVEATANCFYNWYGPADP